jgi:hypothetical protein
VVAEASFLGAENLESVIFPGESNVSGSEGFYGGSGVLLPDGIEEIEYMAFSRCTSLKVIDLGCRLKKLGSWAFNNCLSNVRVDIPDGVRSICTGRFNGCTSLKTMKVGKGVKSVGMLAFDTCSSLIEIILPDGVEEIGDRAFDQCASVKALTIGTGLKRSEDMLLADVQVCLMLFYLTDSRKSALWLSLVAAL